MKKFFLTSMVLFLSNIALVSCSDEVNLEDKNLVNRDRIVTFSEYLRDMEILNGAGTILLQSNEFEAIQDKESRIDLTQREGNTDAIKLYDKNNNHINIANCDSDIQCKRALFGTILEFDIEGQKNELYIPKLIKMDCQNYLMGEGYEVRWNPDDNNSKGVIIWLSYSPLEQMNYELWAKHPRIITHSTTTSDTGSYVIKKEDLEKFPKNAMLNLNIARTNYIINEDTSKPSLIAFTNVSKNVLLHSPE